MEDFRFQPEESTVETEEPLSARRWGSSRRWGLAWGAAGLCGGGVGDAGTQVLALTSPPLLG